jgi:hypothetical protein
MSAGSCHRTAFTTQGILKRPPKGQGYDLATPWWVMNLDAVSFHEVAPNVVNASPNCRRFQMAALVLSIFMQMHIERPQHQVIDAGQKSPFLACLLPGCRAYLCLCPMDWAVVGTN